MRVADEPETPPHLCHTKTAPGDQECSEQGRQTGHGSLHSSVCRQGKQAGWRIPCHLGYQLTYRLSPRRQTQPWSPPGGKHSTKHSPKGLWQSRPCACPKMWLFPGCRECLSLLFPMVGGRDTACMRCAKVEDLISLVAEHKEAMERLSTIRECEQELGWWSNTLPCLTERNWGDTPQIVVDPRPCRCQAEGGVLRDGEEWKHLRVAGKPFPTCLASPGAFTQQV